MFKDLPEDKYNIKYELAQINTLRLMCDRPIPRETLLIEKELKRRLYWLDAEDELLEGK